ncbi:hypothetical protein ASG73_16860 [Janibacter sp. Soil728]|uniref:DUF5302 domain-containing protein n=1 Tax=Janibacter sp. Soil728 TaxID=1736393 RepID=UPI0006F70D3C|nr:DUF5302 domain-containing protein [Janibacter sp. Soil728]KRE35365.1 hypothetical protein ASG73_16860 [Janibacter sp. Soil728]
MSNHESAPEDMKAKFREALEKKQQHGGANVSRGGAHGKVEDSHRAETTATQQMFRRKSG